MRDAAAHSDALLLDNLSAQLVTTISRFVPPGADAALLDVPLHTNVGDHAITLGEIAYLRRLGHRVIHVSSAGAGDPARLRECLSDGVIVLLHGGGNLGDFWPEHQRYREDVLAALPRHRVVQLPQSLWFERESTIEHARRSFGTHPRFSLLVRDQPGADFAARNFACEVALCPDSAMALHPLSRPGGATEDLLYLVRHDHERTLAAERDLPGRSVDWPRPLDAFETRLRAACLSGSSLLVRGPGPPPGLTDRVVLGLHRTLAARRVRHGTELLSRGRAVITDRLHAHLLCLLLGIPHALADTRSGKLHDYARTWTGSSPLVTLVDSLKEGALAMGEEV